MKTFLKKINLKYVKLHSNYKYKNYLGIFIAILIIMCSKYMKAQYILYNTKKKMFS